MRGVVNKVLAIVTILNSCYMLLQAVHNIRPNKVHNFTDEEKYQFLSAANRDYDSGLEVVKKWVSRGINTEVTHSFLSGVPALHLATIKPNPGVVKYLVENGADPDVRDKQKNTPLSVACFHGYKDIVETLLQHKANPNLRDEYGTTALSTAKEQLAKQNNNEQKQNYEHIIALLKQHKAKD